MEKNLDVPEVPADSLNLPETLLNRLNHLEKEVQGFSKDSFVEKTLKEAVEEKEKQENLNLSWNLEPVYSKEPDLQT